MGSFQKTLFRPVTPREVYICRSVEREWPSGEWVDDSPSRHEPNAGEGEGVPEPTAKEDPAPSLTIIGGTKYDQGRFWDHMVTTIGPAIVGEGRGVESDLAKAEAFTTIVILVDPDTFGKSARKVNVEQVLSYDPTSPVLLVGTGERVKQAKSWLKRARWPREVIELP